MNYNFHAIAIQFSVWSELDPSWQTEFIFLNQGDEESLNCLFALTTLFSTIQGRPYNSPQLLLGIWIEVVWSLKGGTETKKTLSF